MRHNSLLFNAELIQRYDVAGPRYTSYPTAVQFNEQFNGSDYHQCVVKSNASGKPLSLYFHIPFCDTVCFYCACNKVVTKDYTRSKKYLHYLDKEMHLQSKLFDSQRKVEQLHWGGGTPTFLNISEMQALMASTHKYFTLLDDDKGEYSIEIDPRSVTGETITALRQLGFNRMSLGVQDFDPLVQRAVNRIQPKSQTLEVIASARENNVKSLSIDLIYGLPLQTCKGFMQTLTEVIEANPDRLSIFNYAHLPKMFKPQRRINEKELPSATEKLQILQKTIEYLTDAGYVYIGMDHFAKPDDELAIAQENGSLYRNFQGYSTHAECDLVAMGITSIAQVANSYSQNVKDLESYYACLDKGELPLFRGILLEHDDVLRRAVITQLICHFKLSFVSIAKTFDIDFYNYFSSELKKLMLMQKDGLLQITEEGIRVHPPGRLLIRNICMVFDKYLNNTERRFSKVI